MGINPEDARQEFLRARDEADTRFGQMNAMLETLRCSFARPDIETPPAETTAIMLCLLQRQVRETQSLWDGFAERRLAALTGGGPPGGGNLRLV